MLLKIEQNHSVVYLSIYSRRGRRKRSGGDVVVTTKGRSQGVWPKRPRTNHLKWRSSERGGKIWGKNLRERFNDGTGFGGKFL